MKIWFSSNFLDRSEADYGQYPTPRWSLCELPVVSPMKLAAVLLDIRRQNVLKHSAK